jgi:hypothetical protein
MSGTSAMLFRYAQSDAAFKIDNIIYAIDKCLRCTEKTFWELLQQVAVLGTNVCFEG